MVERRAQSRADQGCCRAIRRRAKGCAHEESAPTPAILTINRAAALAS